MLENTYINLINKNIRTLNKANEIMGDIQQAVAYNDESRVYDLSLDYERTVERLVPLSRDLVICQGRKELEQAVKQAIQDNAPVKINFTKEGWFVLSIPALLPRKEKGNAQYIREIVHDALSEYCKDKNIQRFGKCILIYEHIYDHRIPKREWRDHDNIEINTVTDMIALFILRDDSPYVCSHVYVSKAGEQNRTNIYVVPETDFDTWRKERRLWYDHPPER